MYGYRYNFNHNFRKRPDSPDTGTRKWTRARSDGNFSFIEYFVRECCHVFIAKIIAREGNLISRGQRGFYFSMFAWKFFFFSWVIKIKVARWFFFFLIFMVFFWDNFRVIIDCYELNMRFFYILRFIGVKVWFAY